MKKDIHPTYYSQTKVRCACGNTLTIGSTKPEINVEVCSRCHPFYTGKEKFMGIAGKVDKFKARREKAAKALKVGKKPRAQKKTKK